MALYTMHAAKGLEWPIVVPINTMTQLRATETAVTDRASGRFYCRVFGVEPTGHAAARDDEGHELDRERVRLWYVAATRARELLVLPRLDVDPRGKAWMSLVDLALDSLPALDLEHHAPEVGAGDAAVETAQTRDVFAAEATAIAERQHSIVWRAPSWDEDTTLPMLREEAPTILATDGDGAPADGAAGAAIQGGRERGTILHKLIEEVLTGETAETLPDPTTRAKTLIRALGLPVMDDPAQGLSDWAGRWMRSTASSSPLWEAGCHSKAVACRRRRGWVRTSSSRDRPRRQRYSAPADPRCGPTMRPFGRTDTGIICHHTPAMGEASCRRAMWCSPNIR